MLCSLEHDYILALVMCVCGLGAGGLLTQSATY